VGDNPDLREAAKIALTQRLSTTGIWAIRVHRVKTQKEVSSA